MEQDYEPLKLIIKTIDECRNMAVIIAQSGEACYTCEIENSLFALYAELDFTLGEIRNKKLSLFGDTLDV